MTRARARHTSLSFAAAVYAVALSCIAAEPSLPVASARLDLDADAACTTRAELVARVHARSPRVQFVDDGSELAIQVQVSTASPGVFAGDISFASSGTKPSLRHVRAHSCSELADAIALIVAVTLDPTAVGPNSKTLTTTDTGTPRGAAAATNTPAAEVSAPATRPKTTAASATETLPVDDGRESNHSRFHPTWGAQLAAGAMAGAAPGVMPGVALFALAGAEQRSVWSPAAVLGVHHAWRTVDEQGDPVNNLERWNT